MIEHLHHDFETFGNLDGTKVGAFRYAQSRTCEPLILTYGYDADNLTTWLPFDGSPPPDDLVEYYADPGVMFAAHNAQFEYCIWRYVMRRRFPKFFRKEIPPDRFMCTAVMCAAAGLPRSLDKVGKVLELPLQKNADGKRLIKKFSALRKPTKANPSNRIRPEDDWADFKNYIAYNVDDVLVEMQLPQHVPQISPKEQRFYAMEMRMNIRGLPLDMRAVRRGLPKLTHLEDLTVARVIKMTGGIKPTQQQQMLKFFQEMGFEDLENLQAKTLKDLLLLRDDLTADQRELLQLRLEGGKASTKKLKKMLAVVCVDGRVRGGFLFYGASTGREAGKLIQPQNFTRGDYKPHQLEELFDLIINGDVDDILMLYKNPIDAIAQGMRGFIKPSPGNKFVVSDFSAIEARVLAWLAGETEVLKLYHENGDVYVRMAAKLYRKDEKQLLIDAKSGEDKEAEKQRKFGKDIVLGCGFQMGGPGFYRNCVMRGIKVEEVECIKAVKVYRKEHPAIKQYWPDVENCAVLAVEEKRKKDNPVRLRQVEFFTERKGKLEFLCVRLPSRRLLRYVQPKVQYVMRYGRRCAKLSYRAEFKGQWVRESTYGGKLVENICQAVARDIMFEAMERAEQRGYPSIGTVHDELITEVKEDFGSAKELEDIMRVKPKWCADAPINAEGWSGFRYRK